MIPFFQEPESIPHSLGDFERHGLMESDNPDLGIQIRYERGASKVDLYLYDFGSHPVPDNVQDLLVLNHFKDCCTGIFALQETNHYRDVELKVCDAWQMTDPNTDIRFLHANFSLGVQASQLSVDIGNHTTHLLVTSFKGYFVKIRFSHPDASERISDIEPFLLELIKELKNA